MKKITKYILTISIIFIQSLCFFGISPVHATQDDRVAINTTHIENGKLKPSFTFNNAEGKKIDDIVVVENLTDAPLKIKVYAADSTTTNQGDFTVKLENEERENVGKWITLSENLVTLPPKGKKTINFSIQIPKSTELIGDFAGGIMAQVVEDTKPATGVQIINRVGMRVYVKINGEIKTSLSIQSLNKFVDESGINYVAIVKNEGNTIVNPDLVSNVEIKPFVATKIITSSKIGDIQPGKTRTVTIRTDQSEPWIGDETITIKALINNQEITSASSHDFYIKPQVYIIAGFVLIVILLVIFMLYHRKKHLKLNPHIRITNSTGKVIDVK